MYLAITKIILLSGWITLLYFFCKKGKIIFGVLAVLWIGIVAMTFELAPLKTGYAMPSLANHRYVSTFLTNSWKQKKEKELPNFWDKGVDIALANRYAAGGKFADDFAYKDVPTVISPIYPFAVSLIHGWSGFDIIKTYDYLGILVFLMVAVMIILFGAPRDSNQNTQKSDYRYEGLIMAFCLLYLSTQYIALAYEKGISRSTFWNTFVLLKPGNFLIYALLPLMYYFLAKGRQWRNAVIGGVIFGIIISLYFAAFIYFGTGILFYLFFLWWKREGKNLKYEINLVGVFFGVALLSSSWYWWPIVSNLNIFREDGISLSQIIFTREIWRVELPWHKLRRVYDPFESTFFMGPLFWLGVIGIFVMWRRKRKGDFLLLGFIASVYFFKIVFYPLTLLIWKDAPHAGECYEYFLRPAMALSAGIAIHSIINLITKHHLDVNDFVKSGLRNNLLIKTMLQKIARRLNFSLKNKAGVTVGFLLILSPYAVPVWHVPQFNWWSQMDNVPYSEKFYNPEFKEFITWIKNETKGDSVFLAGGQTAVKISTYTGRPLMKGIKNGPSIISYKKRLEEARPIYQGSAKTTDLKHLLKKYGISYVVWSKDVKHEYPHTSVGNLRKYSLFKQVYANKELSVFKVNL